MAAAGPVAGAAGTKGLRAGALGFVSNVVIGVASTAPAYSLAVSLGLVAIAVGAASPAVMWVSFLPMLAIAIGYYYLNRAEPDCGTSFTWVTSALGPHLGWMCGWAIIAADVIVMASLAEVAAQYTFGLFGVDVAASPLIPLAIGSQTIDLAVMGLGIAFVAVLTWICYRGIELSALTQLVLLVLELAALGVFAAVALVRVAVDPPEGAMAFSLDWLNPLSIVGTDGAFDTSALAAGMLVTLFIYWGWDSTATVNEESANPTESPGRATVVSTMILVLTYVVVSIAVQSWAGVDRLVAARDSDVFSAIANEVLGSPLDKIVILAVLVSAAASTQTTILPTARTAFSMGARGALPKMWANVHPTFQTPTNATIWMGILSVVFYVALKLISANVYADALTALGMMIAFYYGLTGFASAIFYRQVLLRSVKNFVMIGLVPAAGGVVLAWAFVRSAIDMADPANSWTGESWLGVSVPLAITIITFALGVVLMLLWWRRSPAFFRVRPTTFQEPASTPPIVPPVGPVQHATRGG